jgi:hypothetical protein
MGIIEDYFNIQLVTPFSNVGFAITYVLLIYLVHYFYYEKKFENTNLYFYVNVFTFLWTGENVYR